MNDDDALVAGSADSKLLLCAVGQFLTEVCRHVGNFWYEAAGIGEGTLGNLFDVQDPRTFDEFLHLAGLARKRENIFLLAQDEFMALLTSCSGAMPCLELQSRKKRMGNKNVHYIYVGREILDPSTRNRGRTKDKSASKPKMPLLSQVRDKILPPTQSQAFVVARQRFFAQQPLVGRALRQAAANLDARRQAAANLDAPRQDRTNPEARQQALVEQVPRGLMQSPRMGRRLRGLLRPISTPLSGRQPRSRFARSETPPAVASTRTSTVELMQPCALSTLLDAEPTTAQVPLVTPTEALASNSAGGAPRDFRSLPVERTKKSNELGSPDEQTANLIAMIHNEDMDAEPTSAQVPLVTPTEALASNSAGGAPRDFRSLPVERTKKSWNELGYPDERTANLIAMIHNEDTSFYERGLLITELAKGFMSPIPSPLQLAHRQPDSAARTDDGTTAALKSGSTKVYSATVGKHTVHGIPQTHKLIQKARETKLKDNGMAHAQLKTYLSKQQHTSTPETQFLLGKIAANAPQEAYAKLAKLYTLINAHFLESIGIDYPIEAIARVCPSPNTISNAVDAAAVGTTLILTRVLEENNWPPVYIGSDKGGDAVIIKLYFFNKKRRKIEIILASVDECDGTAEGIADAIVHTMRRLKLTPGTGITSSVPPAIVKGQQTDSGGGGNIEALANKLLEKEYGTLCAKKELYFVGNCFEHNASNSFAYPFNKAFGEGAIEKRNPIQLAHSCYDLLNRLGADVFSTYWASTVDSLHDLSDSEKVELRKAEQIPAAIMTRWSYVSRAFQHVLKYWDVWSKLSEDIPKGTTTVEAVNKIASGLYANMRIPLNRVYIEFLLPFLLKVHDPMMKWCESSDPKVGKVGFRARQALRAYHQYMVSLEKVRRDYSDPESQDFAAFRTLLETLSNKEKDIANIAVAAFFKLGKKKADEHFLRWASTNLIWLAVFDDASNGQVVARILLGQDAPVPNDFDEFVRRRFDVNLLNDLKEVIAEQAEALQAIAAGADMWDELRHKDDVLGKFRELYFTLYSAFPSTNQDVERGVKKKNFIVETGRKSKKSTSYAIAGNMSLGLEAEPDNPTIPERNPTPDDEDSYEDDDGNHKKKRRSPVGTQAAVKNFAMMQAQWTIVEELLDNEASYSDASKSLKAELNDKDEDFQKERVASKLSSFEAGREKEKELNAVQKQQKFNHTPLALGEIVWGDLRKKEHLSDVFKELHYRISSSQITSITVKGIKVTGKDSMEAEIQERYNGQKWKELKEILQGVEGKKKTFKQFNPDEDLFEGIVGA
jgi:hypothetical protein